MSVKPRKAKAHPFKPYPCPVPDCKGMVTKASRTLCFVCIHRAGEAATPEQAAAIREHLETAQQDICRSCKGTYREPALVGCETTYKHWFVLRATRGELGVDKTAYPHRRYQEYKEAIYRVGTWEKVLGTEQTFRMYHDKPGVRHYAL